MSHGKVWFSLRDMPVERQLPEPVDMDVIDREGKKRNLYKMFGMRPVEDIDPLDTVTWWPVE